MEAVIPTRGVRHAHIRITTEHPTEFVDLTDRIKAFVAESGIRFGFVNVQSLHTTTAIVVNENEPLLLGDFVVMLEIIAPSNLPYRHDDLVARTVNVVADERVNGHAHCRAALLGRVGLHQRDRRQPAAGSLAAGVPGGTGRTARTPGLNGDFRRGRTMKVKMILPALTEATSPFFRPIKYSLFPPLGLATLAAYLSPDDDVEIQDEHVETLDLDDTPDLVVIQVYITSAYRAYRLADHYRRKGAYVALGGLHVTSLPDEAAPHADSIFLGPGEDTWPQFLADFRRGEARRVYQSQVRTLERSRRFDAI